MTLGLVHANYSLPECQAVKLTDFASWKGMFFSVELAGICGERTKKSACDAKQMVAHSSFSLFVV